MSPPIRNLIPHFIQSQYDADRFEGQLKAFVLYADIKGFTPLTEAIMADAERGAERLSQVLNEIFEPIVSLIYKRGGFIPLFAGDAITGIFPASNQKLQWQSINAIRTAADIQSMFTELGLQEINGVELQLGIRVGVAYGDLDWGIVGHQNHSFYFKGDAIARAVEAESLGSIDKITLHHSSVDLIEEKRIDVQALNDSIFSLKQLDVSRDIKLPVRTLETQKEILERFLPDSVISYQIDGEFRQVASVFISFTGAQKKEQLDELADIILRFTIQFGGYFKEIEFGDKGGVALCFFGMPISYEDNAERSIEFATAVKEAIVQSSNNAFQVRFGITFGRAFTGIIGGAERCQYAAVGKMVNLAARLMASAQWGEIRVSEEVADLSAHQYEQEGEFYYKGIGRAIKTFTYKGRPNQATRSAEKFVGRAKEKAKLHNWVEQIQPNSPPSFAHVYSDAGMGKSALINEFMQEVQSRLNISFAPADAILQRPFQPFIRLLSQQLGFYEDQKKYSKTRLLQKAIANWKDRVINRDVSFFGSLERVLGGIFDLYEYRDEWQEIDPQSRYELTVNAVLNSLFCISYKAPFLINCIDIHSFDRGSKEVLESIQKTAFQYALGIVVSSRSDAESKSFIQSFSPELSLELPPLDQEETKELVEFLLKGNADSEFVARLHQASLGNPFFINQMIKYEVQSGDIVLRDGVWQLNHPDVVLSTDLDSMFIAQIDAFENETKELIKTAAVFGREFHPSVLSVVQRSINKTLDINSDKINQFIQKGIDSDILEEALDGLYSFKHDHMQEALYNLQLTSLLKTTHAQIATDLIDFYETNIDQHYGQIARHFQSSEQYTTSNTYFDKAAEKAKADYQIPRAIQHYKTILQNFEQNIPEGLHQDKYAITLLNLGTSLEHFGNWEEAEQAIVKAIEEAKQHNYTSTLTRGFNTLGWLYLQKGEYQQALVYSEKALKRYQDNNDEAGGSRSLGQVAEALINLGEYKQAQEYAEQQINICQRIKNKYGESQGYKLLGIIHLEQGEHQAALDDFQKNLKLDKILGNKRRIMRALGNTGLAYWHLNKIEKAQKAFNEQHTIAIELGDKRGISLAVSYKGNVCYSTGQLDNAIIHFLEYYDVSKQLGQSDSIFISLYNIGYIHKMQGSFVKAIEFYNRAFAEGETSSKYLLVNRMLDLGEILYRTEKYAEAKKEIEKGLQDALEIKNDDLIFKGQMLNDILSNINKPKIIYKSLVQMLQTNEESITRKLQLYYEICHLPAIAFEDNDKRSEFLNNSATLFEAYLNETTSHEHQLMLEKLRLLL